MIIDAYRYAVAGGSVNTWDPAKKGTDAVLSGGNLTLKTSSATAQALATGGYTTGKYYWEVQCVAAANPRCIGISRTGGAIDLNTDLGQEAGEYGWYSSGSSYFAGSFGAVSGAAFGAGDIVGIACDFGTRKLWFAVNNAWITGNPAAGTGQMVTYASGLGTIYAAASVTGGTDELLAKFSSGSLTYSPPAGFTAYG